MSTAPTDFDPRPARRNLRFPADVAGSEVRFTDIRGLQVTGKLENESYSGIAAIVTSESGLQMDAQVSVDYFGYPMPGVVRRVAPRPDGTCQIGIEWV